MVNKQVLRETYLEKRLFLSEEEYVLRNSLLSQRFMESVDLSATTSLHTFLPMLEKREVNTWLIINFLRRQHPHINLYTSRTLADGHLEHYLLLEETRLKVSKWGIPEPVDTKPVSLNDLHIILVPLISFDKKGHRIGYGKGYYDRFLKKFPGALKIGVSLSPPLDKINFMDERDVAMHTCITPYAYYKF
jgi:5-formyltetrahydrofolate cyclo-ligase